MYHIVTSQNEYTLEQMLSIIDDALCFGYSFIIQDGLLYYRED